MNVRVHQTATVQAHGVHAVAHIGDAQSFERLQHFLVIFNGKSARGDEVGAGAERVVVGCGLGGSGVEENHSGNKNEREQGGERDETFHGGFFIFPIRFGQQKSEMHV